VPQAEPPLRPEPSEPESLPESPDRDDVIAAMGSVEGAVRDCAAGRSGVSNITITVVGNSGRVSSALVEGEFAGTPEGSCMARAVRGARFERFAQPTFRVRYPFSL
jgi:hypothetical protein